LKQGDLTSAYEDVPEGNHRKYPFAELELEMGSFAKTGVLYECFGMSYIHDATYPRSVLEAILEIAGT
jgi:hypothetical protein